ncbi:DUF2200 family protein [Pediococcus siamensis]|uniref:DUF2200 family protein n=1 Tax=Pediococcus siamensis TaxID=381829 RepID=UPI0039A2F921
MDKSKLMALPMTKMYQLYLDKVTRKGRTKAELDTVLHWLWGEQTIVDGSVAQKATLGQLIAGPLNTHAHLIRGVICGVRVENISDSEMQAIRYMDKLVDELARGKKLSSILRE